MPSVYVYPEEFDRCVEILTRKLEEIATRAGLPDPSLRPSRARSPLCRPSRATAPP
jgi:hypothetical protein